MANNFASAVKKRKGTLVPIDADAEKKYFCIFCGRSADWTALFDAGGGVKQIERYCSNCAKIHVDDKSKTLANK